jgi:hypothetical protein
MNLRHRLLAALVSLLTVIGLILTASPAQALDDSADAVGTVGGPELANIAVTHETPGCYLFTSPVPTLNTVPTTGAHYVDAGANVRCWDGDGVLEKINYIYIAARLQIRSAVTFLWSARASDSGSMTIRPGQGDGDYTVTANMADSCVNSLNRKHRVNYTDVWYRLADGRTHQVTQGTYSTVQPTLACGN